ncbi:hypothetical protein [Methylobacterium nonmethylotrophicum]|uniref:Uncharacterized protein n=1 Tax=Methylobacterium nonmethylotrophicum TaxID=1141884 RepID=A0A4Z0NEY9_9HYPH|nr:hypothetical protein [Methylobacterium nonmethylotrophicum]TGD93725.1 hypothetical protein EU555_33090 [Methylobacterium nonmethylotrophicum]
MSITHDDAWISGPDPHSSVKRVYSDGKMLGRVRCWRTEDPGDLTGEWFTVERWKSGLYVPLEGMHEDFQEALDRVARYGAAQ